MRAMTPRESFAEITETIRACARHMPRLVSSIRAGHSHARDDAEWMMVNLERAAIAAEVILKRWEASERLRERHDRLHHAGR